LAGILAGAVVLALKTKNWQPVVADVVADVPIVIDAVEADKTKSNSVVVKASFPKTK
jgi:hypothetical protein